MIKSSQLFIRCAIAGLLLSPIAAFSQSAMTAPLGGMVIPLTPGADNLLSIPFTTLPVFAGPVEQIVDNSGTIDNSHAISFPASVPAAAEGAWNDLFYIRFTSGTANGKYFTVLESTDLGIIIDSIGDDLSSVSADDTYEVFRYWTLATLFPPATQTALLQSTGNFAFQRGSEILMPDTTGVGRNRAPNRAFFVTSTQWVSAGALQNSDDTILPPDTYIIIRQHPGAGSRSFLVSGSVPMSNHVINLHQSLITTDNYVSVSRPLTVTLDELGLNSDDVFVPSAGNFAFQRQDELLVWTGTPSRNKAPTNAFFRVGSNWISAGSLEVSNDFPINGYSPIVIRKKQQPTESTVFWQNSSNY